MTCDCHSHNAGAGSTPEVILHQRQYFPDAYKDEVAVDACIAEQIEALWKVGVPTRGSCCGHNGAFGPPWVVLDSPLDAVMANAVLSRHTREWHVIFWSGQTAPLDTKGLLLSDYAKMQRDLAIANKRVKNLLRANRRLKKKAAERLEELQTGHQAIVSTRSEPEAMASYPAVQAFLDRHVLQYMHDNSGGRGYGFFAFHLRCFVNDWITKDMARAICRSLTDRGYARYERGLWNEDGETAGAGYRITEAGREYLAQLA
ncbi:MAG: hypothetical protein GYB53_23880 [Rhodobacteraceae bacterium]|nr:hypothetical protein [Paracoccaceae bacterium]MBR9823696.1 hypothetical protein [Paracoccaceae bacterium]